MAIITYLVIIAICAGLAALAVRAADIEFGPPQVEATEIGPAYYLPVKIMIITQVPEGPAILLLDN